MQQLGLQSRGISAISSIKIVPLSHISNFPALVRSAPVNRPRSYPNSSLSNSSLARAAQFILTNLNPDLTRKLVDQPGGHLFSSSALANDKHGNIHLRQQLCLRAELAHGWTSRDKERLITALLDVLIAISRSALLPLCLRDIKWCLMTASSCSFCRGRTR
jgi:hypothetical protein